MTIEVEYIIVITIEVDYIILMTIEVEYIILMTIEVDWILVIIDVDAYWCLIVDYIIWGLKLACDYIDERVDLLLSAKVGLFFIIWNPTQSRSRDSKAEDSEGCRLQLNSLLYLRFGQKQVTWLEQPKIFVQKPWIGSKSCFGGHVPDKSHFRKVIETKINRIQSGFSGKT